MGKWLATLITTVVIFFGIDITVEVYDWLKGSSTEWSRIDTVLGSVLSWSIAERIVDEIRKENIRENFERRN